MVGAVAGAALAVAIWLLTYELERLGQKPPSTSQKDDQAAPATTEDGS